MYVYIYIYTYVIMCVCVWKNGKNLSQIIIARRKNYANWGLRFLGYFPAMFKLWMQEHKPS